MIPEQPNLALELFLVKKLDEPKSIPGGLDHKEQQIHRH